MTRIILFNKPYGVLCQFTDAEGRATLKDYINIPNVYAAGRLDRDSEGLLILTDNGKLQNRIASPKAKTAKDYWVQVEGTPQEAQLGEFRRGLTLKDGATKPAGAVVISEPPNLWPRTPPIRVRKSIPDTWLDIRLTEGRNRQVRRMTAAIGHPTLRLIRHRIGDWSLEDLKPGDWREV